MQNGHPISSLMLFTLIAVVVIVAGALAWHLRKPGNRHPMEGERERTGAEINREAGEP